MSDISISGQFFRKYFITGEFPQHPDSGLPSMLQNFNRRFNILIRSKCILVLALLRVWFLVCLYFSCKEQAALGSRLSWGPCGQNFVANCWCLVQTLTDSVGRTGSRSMWRGTRLEYLKRRTPLKFRSRLGNNIKMDLRFWNEQRYVLSVIFCNNTSRPRGIRHVWSWTARTLGSLVRIPLETWIYVRVFLLCM